MEESVKVTIRCLVYNHEKYIRKCLDGFVMQRTNFRFEAIVHDDASTDRSADIIREYAGKYPDIIKPVLEAENQYSKKDGSLKRIMNKHTKGKYVAMCEGDDYWTDPYKLQKQVDFLEEHPEYSMCCHNTDLNQANKNVGVVPNIKSDTDFSAEMMIENGGGFIATNSIMYVSSLVLPYIEEFSKGFSVGDYPLQMLCGIKGKVRCLSSRMSVYNLNVPGSWTDRNRTETVGKYQARLTEEIKWMIKTDEKTGFQYHTSFTYVVGKCQFLIAEMVDDLHTVFSKEEFRLFFKKQSCIKRMRIRMIKCGIKQTSLYKLLNKMRFF